VHVEELLLDFAETMFASLIYDVVTIHSDEKAIHHRLPGKICKRWS